MCLRALDTNSLCAKNVRRNGKNMSRKSWNQKSVIAGMTALAVLTTAVGMSGMNVSAAENAQSKEEVVYVMTGADGTVESVNVVTFSTEKEKVYYQGTLENAQIPWKISVKYILDGKELSPDELAGSSGQLVIALKVEKNDACMGEFYEDYALQINMTLSAQNCENISAEGATVANVGADKQIRRRGGASGGKHGGDTDIDRADQ